MKSRATNQGTPFSYNVPGTDNELLVHHYGNFGLWIGGDYRLVAGEINAMNLLFYSLKYQEIHMRKLIADYFGTFTLKTEVFSLHRIISSPRPLLHVILIYKHSESQFLKNSERLMELRTTKLLRQLRRGNAFKYNANTKRLIRLPIKITSQVIKKF